MLTSDLAPGGRPTFIAARGMTDPRDCDRTRVPICGDCGTTLPVINPTPNEAEGYCGPCWRGESEGRSCTSCGYHECECGETRMTVEKAVEAMFSPIFHVLRAMADR